MFEALRSAQKISKHEFKRDEPKLRGALIDAQFDLLEAGNFSVVVLLSGLDAPGRSAAAKQLMSWMDPRELHPYALSRPSTDERERPRMWRFWRALPPKGDIGIFLNAWYEEPITDHLLDRIDRHEFRARIQEILRFEQMLAQDGVVFLKFMFVLSKHKHIKVLKKIKEDPSIAWKISDEEVAIGEAFAKRYEHSVGITEELLTSTSKGFAPWITLPSDNPYFRDLTIGRAMVDAIGDRLREPSTTVHGFTMPAAFTIKSANVLDSIDLSKSLKHDTYKARLKKARHRLTKLTLGKAFENHPCLLVFEGNDASGKGGGIRRVVQALDPRMTNLIPVAAPTEEEKAHHFLWRFWRQIPPNGHITIFDRSWYGRVLVERVEGFCSEQEWMYAYDDIRSFEQELTDQGAIIVKFWLAIDRDEQLKRFEERRKVGYKRYKITDEDWRNREKWDQYKDAVHDMVVRTSTNQSPWTLIEANDKYFARVEILRTINDRLATALSAPRKNA